MDKNYRIEWYNKARTVLIVNYLGDAVLADVLASNVEAFAMLAALPQEIILIHNGGEYDVAFELLGIGKIKDSVYSKFPAIPQNLKSVIIVLGSASTRRQMGSALQVLDRLFFRRRMTHTVSNMEEAHKLILKEGFSLED